ncbi:substrate-binding periplasmic protein [Kordiimonas aquimaris]|uniref:substrate-binding periplasmic protein n=1 Tax=Kordiimonas aquimaris TaxID=707591 RepID=UPI0021D31DCB|nr:transporter substrate-binding domain-containing protein [Kordiimonas aquimaris]
MISLTQIKCLRRVAFVTLSCLAFPVASAGQNLSGKAVSIEIAGVIIPGLFDMGNPGPYNEIYDLITADYTQPIRLRALPIRRARRSFFGERSDCIFVGSATPRVYAERGMTADDLVFSKSINSISMMAYTRPGEPVIRSEDDLEGKLIALDAGAGSVDFVKPLFLPESTGAIQTNTPAQAFALLEQRRVDVAVAFDYDVSLLMKRDPAIANFEFEADYSIVSNEDVLVCRRSKQVEELMSHVNDKLEALRASGRLSEITGN